ncbi:uncharacterized protein LOC122278791 [Carya illinoinensis]|uniref:uncharacterized protein LOC122278791 n=1 Tax=Carya illinoinensis TaxID=32201 RepID=UPI001C725A96|nr:uncharacterized protein LOC122278791 [Carya illinoinensis]
MKDFRDVFDDCELRDLGYFGPPFTWCNKREPACSISERLDRVLSNHRWGLYYPMARVQHGVATYSDHLPIILRANEVHVQGRSKRPYRFEAMWVDSPDCKTIIENAWYEEQVADGCSAVMRKIKGCGEKLTSWNKSKFGHVRQGLQKARSKLKWLQSSDPCFQRRDEHSKARAAMQVWMEREEIMWRQRLKSLWLKEGDSNTRFFHNKATQRRKKNWIEGLRGENGDWKFNEE